MSRLPKVDIASPYARVGAKLVDQGWHAIPCRPGSKRPGVFANGYWQGLTGWNEYCDRAPTEDEVERWNKWPAAGVCVALDHVVKVVDIDTDDAEMRAAIAEILPDSPVKKRGQKGFSAFYRGSANIISRAFSISVFGKQERIVDLLAYGKQTVCPPTIHPDTDEPYRWLGEPLEDYAPEDLPWLDDDIADRLERVLAPFGYVAPIEHEYTSVDAGDTVWREVNDLALANLDLWVPGLQLPMTKRTGDGRYRAVAEWRGVDNPNLGFSAKGITDWGNGETHTPLDVVMYSFSASLDVATDWLKGRLNYQEAPYVDPSRMIANGRKKRDVPHEQNINRPEDGSAAAVSPEATTTLAPANQNRQHYNPFTPQAAGGVLGAIAQWAYDTGRRPVPEFSILAAVSFMSVMFGRRAVGPTGAGLNVYMVGIAGPGFGKEHPLKAVQTLAVDLQMPFLIGPGEVTSGSAIEKVVRRRPVFLMPWDEMGVVLQSVNGRGSSSWAQTIRKVLLEIFSKSTSMWSGKEHADPEKDSSAEPVFMPTVSLMGMSTPTTFYKGITEESLTDGFVARLVVTEPSVRPERHSAPPVLVTPVSLITAVKKCRDDFPKPGGDLAQVAWRQATSRPTLYTVPWETAEAEKRWTDIEDWQIAEIEDNGASEGIVGRTAEHTIKLATIRAISRRPSDPAVSIEDVEWGHAIVQASLASINRGVEEYMAGSQFEELCKAILSALRGTKDKSLPQSQLVRKRGVSKADDRMVEQAIKRLVLAGEIEQPKIDGKGVKVRLAEQKVAA
ncbi:bifunctional DNA primase/polymerase [Shinella zoogloeoides]|uniref:bifunctional DNA primase/polymerase n=1 Tax=Shinella zoogloeoides TaxID=352475 RepID=UPI001F5900FE|nr:bifunctional DNA primase/polymerase [Shinella zoogloeoides]